MLRKHQYYVWCCQQRPIALSWRPRQNQVFAELRYSLLKHLKKTKFWFYKITCGNYSTSSTSYIYNGNDAMLTYLIYKDDSWKLLPYAIWKVAIIIWISNEITNCDFLSCRIARLMNYYFLLYIYLYGGLFRTRWKNKPFSSSAQAKY